MNIIQRPRSREFCATMQDYIIDTDATITFKVMYGGHTILEEEYVPDADYKVRIRKLGKFCELALWGVWNANEPTPQSNIAGEFSFYINDTLDTTSFVIYSSLQTAKDANTPGILSEVTHKVTRPGTVEWISATPVGNKFDVVAHFDDGNIGNGTIPVTDTSGDIYTVNVGIDVVQALFPDATISHYKVNAGGGSMTYFIDSTPYSTLRTFRFKNIYDMPDTVTAVGGITIKGANKAEMAVMNGIDRKFLVDISDEYTVKSGPILLQSDYRLWHNFINAREVEIRQGDKWLPIIIEKYTYERELTKSILKEVLFTFTMADADQNGMIEL